jgi:transposase-like protein
LPGKGAIKLQIDATYFGTEYGFICFHDCNKVVYFHEIKAETSRDIILGLRTLKGAGYRFKSVTIDGRKGFDEAIRKELGGVPIQLCLFHARAVVRKYLGPSPTAESAVDLSILMSKLTTIEPQDFIDQFQRLTIKHRIALLPSFIKANRRRQRTRLAYRFIEHNMHRIFTYKDIPDVNIPPTTNHLEGLFSHIKERLYLHRGLQQSRKKTAIKFLLKNF